MHAIYGGVVPELASRDHVRRVLPLAQQRAGRGRARRSPTSTASPTREGPGLAGALLVGASVASALGLRARQAGGRRPPPGRPPAVAAAGRSAARRFRSSRCWCRAATPSSFEVDGVGRYRLLGDTQDDAAGEAFDKTAKLLGLPYPGGPALAQLAEAGRDGAVALPRPMLDERRSRLQLQRPEDRGAAARAPRGGARSARRRAPRRHRARVPARGRRRARREGARGARRDRTARGWSWPAAWAPIANCARGSRRRSRAAAAQVYFPDLEFCTDNGAMIALAGALRLAHAARRLRVRGAAAMGARVTQRGRHATHSILDGTS